MLNTIAVDRQLLIKELVAHSIQNMLCTFDTKRTPCFLFHWGRVTHICIGNLTIIGSDNDLSPDQHQAII